MLIGGYQRLTLIDYPGKIAATIFTSGCSFRCPFCHNPELVNIAGLGHDARTEKEFFDFLKKRRGKLEGVCVTGGEPTIQPDILEFMRKLKRRGLFVKLDTNGSRPDVLLKALDSKLVDFVAMDIKHAPKKYSKAVGLVPDIEKVKASVELIRHRAPDYEFRTTAVPGIHTEKDFLEIAKWIGGSKSYWLQKFRDLRLLDESLRQKAAKATLDLEKIRETLVPHFGQVGIRE